MTVGTRHEVLTSMGMQMELPMAVLLKRRAAAAKKVRSGRRVRGDMLPERIRYQDDGCEISPHCLSCPLPRCRYDEPGGLNGVLTRMRDSEIVRLRAKGAAVEQIADVFGVSRRTVFRVLTAKHRARRPVGEARCA